MQMTYQSIGTLKCDERYRFETPRQGVLATNTGVIELNPHCNYEQAVTDLEGFDRIWVIYSFHLNTTWKPKIMPPRSSDNKKVGVFASRSPHRPNSIGMSCVELEKVEGRKLYIKNFDLLHETPILDIKPYIPYCDSFPDAQTGWIPADVASTHTCEFSDYFIEQAEFIHKAYGLNMVSFAELQLSNSPLSTERKRLYTIDKEQGFYQLGCRTWRIHFILSESTIAVKEISSSYNPDELIEGADDKYNDKDVHRAFLAEFPH